MERARQAGNNHLADPGFLQALQRFDTSAWHDLANDDRRLLAHWCLEFGVPETGVDDVIQNILLSALRRITEFHPRADAGLAGWLRTIAHNKAMDERRRYARHHPSGKPVRTHAAASAAEEAEPRSALGASLLRAAMALRSEVAESTWTAFWETAVEGRSAAEVAEELHMTATAVRLAKARCRERLKAQFS